MSAVTLTVHCPHHACSVFSVTCMLYLLSFCLPTVYCLTFTAPPPERDAEQLVSNLARSVKFTELFASLCDQKFPAQACGFDFEYFTFFSCCFKYSSPFPLLA
ncbi:hypothetical protein XENOCAPTIV_002917 [Xenoophorus captivus]|uniref:Secreted protein n=1 Tax=Xenoophorus captivus TaxID=1517983 RepID=A0ABV0R2A5_9TELE